MSTTETHQPDLVAVKSRQRQTWASGDYAAVASRIVLMAERLADAADLRAGEPAAAEGLSVDFAEGDAEALQFPDGAFDAVLSCVGVMFTPDQGRAAAELVRCAGPGGTVALANWTPSSLVGHLFRTVTGYVPAPAGVRPPGLWGTEERLQELLGPAVSRLEVARRRAGR